MNRYSIIAVLVIAVTALVLLDSSTATASASQTVFVDRRDRTSDESGCGSKTNPCNTAQAAIDRAGQENTISLTAGRYGEVTIDKRITLLAPEGNATFSALTLEDDAEILGSSGVSARTVHVRAGAKIHEGILLVSSGGKVFVETGTYRESIFINRSVTVIGIDRPVIDAQGFPFGINIRGAKTVATVEGFTVQHAELVGIFAGGADPITEPPRKVFIRNNTVYMLSSASNATGILIGNGVRGVVSDNTIRGKFDLKDNPNWLGKGIVLAGSTGVIVKRNTVMNNAVGIGVVGYGEFLQAPARNNVLSENLVAMNAVGISVEGKVSRTRIEDNRIIGNLLGLRSLAFNHDGFEHATPSSTIFQFNEIQDNVRGVATLVFGAGTENILPELLIVNSNWWGSFTGPLHKTLNRAGAGNEVNGDVNFSPWCATNECEELYGIPTKLVFEAEWSGVRIEKLQFTVIAQDDKGRLGVNFEGRVNIAVQTATACGTLRGELAVNAINGKALFTNASLSRAGNDCELRAFSPGSGLTEGTSGSSFVIVEVPTPGDSLIASDPEISEFVKVPELEFTPPEEDDHITFSTDEVWPTDALIRALGDSGCAVYSMTTFDLGSGVFNNYIDRASGRINPAFPAVLPTNTLLIVRCK